MGYSYFFLLAIRSLPKDLPRDENALDEYFEKIVAEAYAYYDKCDQSLNERPWFIREIGTKQSGGAGSYGCGDSKNPVCPHMEYLSGKFPGTTFDLYYIYWDRKTMRVQSFLDGKLTDEKTYDHEYYKMHTGTPSIGISFRYTYIPCNISNYFNPNYDCDFEYDSKILG